MNKMRERYRELAEKYPILCSALTCGVLTFIIGAIVLLMLAFVLNATGHYGNLEAALDLKHNSFVFLTPLWTLVALSVLCGMSGVLMYFHKYKRTQVKSDFRDALAPALGMEVGKKG